MSDNDDEVPLEDFGGDGQDYSIHFAGKNIFGSSEDEVNWAKWVAINLGFELIIESHKNNGKKKLLKCARGGRYGGVLRNLDAVVKRKSKTKACNCSFELYVQKMCDDYGWMVITLHAQKGMHNHALGVYKEGYRQMSGLSDASKKIVRDMTSAQAKPCHIFAAVKEKNPQDNANIRHAYNFRDSLRTESFDGRDVARNFFTSLGKITTWFHNMLMEKQGCLLICLWHIQNRSNFFAHTIGSFCMDSTYKANRYKMPFFEMTGITPCNKNFMIAYGIMKDETESSYHWVLENLRNLIGADVHPTAIVTDQDLGLMRPIVDIFLAISHLLCTWHINQDVEHNVYKHCKDKNFAEHFKIGRWRRILKVQIEAEYDAAVIKMTDVMYPRPQIISYLNKTWLVHKEKFVDAWTNKVLHFGNTTTCRVESSHVQLKQWLNSFTGALDTVWMKVHKEIDGQLTQIRHTLEDSRRRVSVGVLHSGFIFNYLKNHVSHYCLEILNGEMKQMKELSNEVFERCGCSLRYTHGIPCACVLWVHVVEEESISLEQIHPFWKLLVYDSQDASSGNGLSEEHRYFMSLVDEVKARDPAVVRKISRLVHDELNPNDAGYYEPEVNTNVRGRPKNFESTPRDRSKWEYRDSRHTSSSSMGRGRGRSSCALGGCGRSSSSSVHYSATTDEMRLDISDYIHRDKIQPLILPYVVGYEDVVADGNCGFRVIASFAFESQHRWRLVRQAIAGELIRYPHLYQPVYINPIEQAINRIMWDGGRCESNHWMTVIEDLFPIASFFCAAVFCFGEVRGQCFTVLPLDALSTASHPECEYVIQHLGSHYQHFILLDLCSGFPAPPIPTNWYSNCDRSVVGWETFYDDRRLLWDRISEH